MAINEAVVGPRLVVSTQRMRISAGRDIVELETAVTAGISAYGEVGCDCQIPAGRDRWVKQVVSAVAEDNPRGCLFDLSNLPVGRAIDSTGRRRGDIGRVDW